MPIATNPRPYIYVTDPETVAEKAAKLRVRAPEALRNATDMIDLLDFLSREDVDVLLLTLNSLIELLGSPGRFHITTDSPTGFREVAYLFPSGELLCFSGEDLNGAQPGERALEVATRIAQLATGPDPIDT